MDLAEGYDVRAYELGPLGTIMELCQECASNRNHGHPMYPFLIEEYEDSIQYVRKFFCGECGKMQSHECGLEMLL